MATHVVLLRGVNVGGNNRLPMAEFRRVLESLGYDGVATYLQSGNAVCRAPGPTDEVADAVARALEDDLGLAVPVVTRSADQWAELVAANPLAHLEEDPKRLHVTFLDAPPDPERVVALASEAATLAPECIEVVGADAYLHTPHGFADTKFTPAFLERRLGRVATTRNWRTVLALAEMVDAAG